MTSLKHKFPKIKKCPIGFFKNRLFKNSINRYLLKLTGIFYMKSITKCFCLVALVIMAMHWKG